MSGNDVKPDSSDGILDDIWSGTVEGFDWLKSVLYGEFAENRPLSALVADLLASFIPGVVIVTSARDAVAVIVRLAQHPEKREDVMEWVVLSACLISLALPVAMAAGGVVFAGVGAVVGGVAGSELGAALRAVMLMLIHEARKLVEMLRFLQKFIHGDILLFLRAIKFAKYERALLYVVKKFVIKMIRISRALRARLQKFAYFDDVKAVIDKLAAWEHKFYAVQTEAMHKIPLAMGELQARLTKVLAQVAPKEIHTVTAGVSAEKPVAKAVKAQQVHDVPGRPLLAEGAAGEGKAGTRVTKPEKIEPVPETSNTRRQQTGEPDNPNKKPLKFDYPFDLSERVAKEAQEVIKSGVDKGPAISRVGSHALKLESPPFFNFTKAELKATTNRFPGVRMLEKGGLEYVVDDVEKFMKAMKESYEGAGQVMHPATEAAIRSRIAKGAKLPVMDGLPGAHAEVLAQNWFFNHAKGAKGDITAVTYRLKGPKAGEMFPACSHCSHILLPSVNVFTKRRVD